MMMEANAWNGLCDFDVIMRLTVGITEMPGWKTRHFFFEGHGIGFGVIAFCKASS